MDLAWEVFSDYLFAIHQRFKIKVCCFVLMPNHFHLICLDPNAQLSSAMSLFMKETSREINRLSERINRLWGKPYFSSIISNPIYYLHAYKYIYRNPVAAEFCEKVEDYQWSSLQILLGKRPGIVPLVEDDTLFSSVEATINWLNIAYTKQDAEYLSKAFRKKAFEIPHKKESKEKNPLCEWYSLPSFYAPPNQLLGGTSVSA